MWKRGIEKGQATSLGSMQTAALRDGVQTAARDKERQVKRIEGGRWYLHMEDLARARARASSPRMRGMFTISA